MTSQLAAQLQALAVSNGVSAKSKHSTRPSLLYHPSKAADIDLRTIFDAAESGLEELIHMDGRFKAYRLSLFSTEKINEDRELQSKEVNENLNKLISAYLRLLSGYVLLTPAHLTLEYLIRRFKIEVHNVEDVVLCILPCHETTLFVRIIQLLHLKNTRWHFLEALKDTGGPPPRQWLVKKCTTDMAVLEAICDSAVSVSELAVKARTIISFTFVVIVETLAEVRTVSSELVNKMQPLILHSLEKRLDEDYRVGALMVVGALANRTTLSSLFVETLFDLVARAFVKGLKRDGVSLLQLQIMVLIQLVQTQELAAFPLKAFKTLVKTRDFLSTLTELAKVFHAQKFLELYVQALLDHCLINEHYETALIHTISLLPLNQQAETMVVKLLDLGFGNEGESDSSKIKDFVKRVLEAMEKRFPVELDKGVSTFFKKSQLSTKEKKNSPLFGFLTEIFQGSLRSPLAESNMSLYLSLDHPQAQVRELALKKLTELAASSKPNERGEINIVLREAYLRRLSDENYNILRAVLSAEDLVKLVPPKPLFDSLSSLLATCSTKMSEGTDPSMNDVKSIAKKSVQLLTSRFVEEHPSYVEALGLVLMDHLLQYPKTRRLNKYVLEAAGTLTFSLFEDLSKVLEETSFQDENEGTKRKEKVRKQKERLTDVNQKIVEYLAGRVAKHPTALGPLLLRSNMSSNSKLLVALVLLQNFQEHSTDILPSFVEASLRWLRDEWTALASEKSLSALELEKIDYSGWTHLFRMRSDSKSSDVYSELLLRALHCVVVCVPFNDDVSPESEGETGQDIKDELFFFFAGFSSVKVFIPHIELLLSRLPAPDTFAFLSKFFISEGSAVPAFIRVHSLDVLASQLRKYSDKLKLPDGISVNHLEGLLTPLLVALSSPLKAVRRSATRCLESLLLNWERQDQRGNKGHYSAEAPSRDFSVFGDLITALVVAKETFLASGSALGQFLSEKFGPVRESGADVIVRGNGDVRHQSVVTFLVNHTFRLPLHAQRVIFSALRGIAYGSELVSATHERFKQLVEHRKLCHLQNYSKGTFEKLADGEIQLLEVLVQMYTPGVIRNGENPMPAFLETLHVDGGSLQDRAVVQPCCAALKCLTPEFYGALSRPSQDLVFQSLITLSTIDNESLRSAAHAVLRAIKIDATTVARHVEDLVNEEDRPAIVSRSKKKSKIMEAQPSERTNWPLKGHLESCASSVLELLLWKSDMVGRHVLVSPLCKLLRSILSGKWPHWAIEDASTEETPEKKEQALAHAGTILNIQHLVLMILDRIARDLVAGVEKFKDITGQAGFDVDSVVVSVNKATDVATRNYALALLTSLGKLVPQAVLKHVIDILGVVGESAVTQDDSHSHEVVSQMLTAVVPVWLSSERDPTALLQVFVSALPRVPPHRRMTLVTNLLRVTAVEESLHIFVYLLLREATAEDSLELEFASTLCRHYSLDARLPALVKLLRMVKVDDKTSLGDKLSRKTAWALQQRGTQLVANHLRSSEGHADADVSEGLQSSYVALMEQALLQLQTLGKSTTIPSRLKKVSQESACALLDGLTHVMASREYIKGISFLLTHSDSSIRRKALRMYAAKLKEDELPKRSRQFRKKQTGGKLVDEDGFGEEELEIRSNMVKDITELLVGPREEQSISVKIAAVDALDISALHFGEKLPEIFTAALSALIRNFLLENRTLIASAVRCVSTIIAQLGPLALPALSETVMGLFDVADKTLGQPEKLVSKTDEEELESSGQEQSELLLAVLLAIETLLDKLGSFLTPYLQKIVGLVVLQPSLVTGSVVEISKKADDVRALITTKLPARLLLDPLMNVYEKAVEAGEESVCALFNMLGAMTSKLDRPSVAAYHAKIFDLCLAAFDLRRKSLSLLPNISRVETSVVSAIISLVMKLSETSFKPLFVRVLEWAELEDSTGACVAGKSVDRNIVFYKLVNQLADKLRSVFVPYFQYLLNGCVQYLMSGTDPRRPKKKKKKHFEELSASTAEWHLRQLVLSSLHKCFLYDNVGFLDTAKFEKLLEPIVTQIGVDPPSTLRATTQVPSVQEMDDTIVACLGQMALTAGTDLLWKPLNHEVLMSTRWLNERSRLLGLRVVKFLAEHLKEEYLVLLPETIPFLAELLEDEELTVVAKTQEVVKLLEDLSGENLSQYF